MTADYLQRSMALNGFDNIHLIRAALSAEPGQARLSLYPDAETNSLVSQTGTSDYETVELLTLDDCAQQYGWQDIDFVKLDAEGEEQRINPGRGTIPGGEFVLAYVRTQAQCQRQSRIDRPVCSSLHRWMPLHRTNIPC